MIANVYGKRRTIAELREEHDTLARLHQQACNAYADPEHSHLRAIERRMNEAAAILREAERRCTEGGGTPDPGTTGEPPAFGPATRGER